MTEASAQTSPASAAKSMDDIVALCRRRGFIFQSSEIYGGINGFWDYGPLGAQLKKNLKDAWWEDVVLRELIGPDGKPVEMVGLDTTIIMHPKVWEASGHVAGFNDPMVACKAEGCKKLFRADHVWVLVWADFDRVRQAAASAEPLFDVSDVQRYANILQDHAAGTNLSDADREFILEWNRVNQYSSYKVFGPLVKTAIAGEEGEAVKGAQLTKSERKLVRDPKLIWCSQLDEYNGSWGGVVCPHCGSRDSLTEPRQFNLMFESHAGAIQDESSKVYLRPETAQGIFVNFWNVVDTSRVRIPFGIAQMGKAFRNEVTPRNFIFRVREFEQMEIEFFIHPSEANEWYAFWRDNRYKWWQSIGLAGDNLQLREHGKDELAHYAKEGAGTSDIEYRFPFTAPGFGELEGVSHRADFDLKAHANACGKGEKMRYFDQEKNERYFPHVIEPSAGADRGTLALLCEAFTPDATRPSGVYMNFNPRIAPIKAAVFPLVNKDGMPEVAEKLYRELRKGRGRWMVDYDAKQSIGKRYARMDEAGTPYCFTVDGDTLKDQTVTVRHRDTQAQERIGIDKVSEFLAERIG